MDDIVLPDLDFEGSACWTLLAFGDCQLQYDTNNILLAEHAFDESMPRAEHLLDYGKNDVLLR